MHKYKDVPKLFTVNLSTINFSLIWTDNIFATQGQNVGSTFKYYNMSEFADVFVPN